MKEPIDRFPTLPFPANEKFSSLSFLRTSILVKKKKEDIISNWIYTDRFYQNFKQLDVVAYYVPTKLFQREILYLTVCDLSLAKTMDVYIFDNFQSSFESIHQSNKTGINALSLMSNSTPTKEMLGQVEKKMVFVGNFQYEELDFAELKKRNRN